MTREAGFRYWAARVLAYAAIVVVTMTSLPDGPSLALAHWFGGTAFALAVTAGAALVAFACTEARACSRGGRVLALAAVVLAALCSLDALRAGSGAVAAAFTAALALALERGGTRGTLAATAIAVLWCNVTAVGLIAPFVALTFALGATFDGADARARRLAWYAVGGCALATLATPGGVSFPAHAFAALRIDRALDGVVAIHPAEVAPAAYHLGFTLVVLAFLAFGSGNRVRAGDASLVIFATLLGLANGAYLAIFGVLVAPVLARSAYEAFGRADVREGALRAGDAALVAAALAFAGALAFVAAPRADAALAAQPYALATSVFARGTPHRFYCSNPDWCGYVLATGPRGTSVLLDGRVVAYSADALEAQRKIAHVSPGWRAALDRERIDVLLVRRDRALATLLAMRGDWRSVASDATAEAFERTAALRTAASR